MRSGIRCVGLLLLLLASTSVCRSEAEVTARALTCKRIQLPAEYTADERGLFNPAAVRHPQLGWCMTFRYDPCHTGKSPKCDRTYTRPYLSRLGSSPLPDLSLAASTLVPLRYNNATILHIHAALKTNDTLIGDLRYAECFALLASSTSRGALRVVHYTRAAGVQAICVGQ